MSHATRVNIGSNRTFQKMKWQTRESEIKSGSGGNIVAYPSETSSRKFYKLVAE